jgi:hypothetical protein
MSILARLGMRGQSPADYEVESVPIVSVDQRPLKADAQKFVRVDIPEGADVSREDFQTLQGSLIEERAERQFNEAALANEIQRLKFIVGKLYESLAKIDPKFISSTLPELQPFETVFLGPSIFQTRPVPSDPQVDSNCAGNQAFRHGQWSKKVNNAKCVAWNSTIDFPVFGKVRLQESVLKPVDHIESVSEGRESWSFLVEHSQQMSDLEQIFERKGMTGSALADVASFGPGQLLSFFHASVTTIGVFITFVVIMIKICLCCAISHSCCKLSKKEKAVRNLSNRTGMFDNKAFVDIPLTTLA